MLTLHNSHNKESELLELVLKAKGIEFTSETVASELTLDDKGLLIDDTFVAIKYLNEKFPKPNLFSTSPEQTSRLNLFLLEILEVYESNDTEDLFEELQKVGIPDSFITGDNISILDLCLYPILPNNKNWKDYKQRITEYLDKHQYK